MQVVDDVPSEIQEPGARRCTPECSVFSAHFVWLLNESDRTSFGAGDCYATEINDNKNTLVYIYIKKYLRSNIYLPAVDIGSFFTEC